MNGPVQRNSLPKSDVGGAPLPSESVAAGLGNQTSPSTAVPAPRRSRAIMLTLVGIGALAIGYGVYDAFQDDDPQVATEEQRNGYSSQEECERNYSKDQCTTDLSAGCRFYPDFLGALL